MTEPTILLTNDDGVTAPGLKALRGALARIGSVTVVAPATDMSGTGRAFSLGRGTDFLSNVLESERTLESTEDYYGFSVPYQLQGDAYAIEGTPSECVLIGHDIVPEPDVVVSGCNPGINSGRPTISRSGTIGAAVEASLAGTPAIAVSMAIADSYESIAVEEFDRAAQFTTSLVELCLQNSVFSAVDFLNVGIPHQDAPLVDVRLTGPDETHRVSARRDGEESFTIQIASGSAAGKLDTDGGMTDRQAIAANYATISPYTLPHAFRQPESVESVAAELSEEFSISTTGDDAV